MKMLISDRSVTSRLFCAFLCQVFEGLQDKERPSAFQTRLGGSKGMLTLDPNLTGMKIMVRKSMFKFECSHRKVEVMRRTQPSKISFTYRYFPAGELGHMKFTFSKQVTRASVFWLLISFLCDRGQLVVGNYRMF